jgi:hypothetical protein
MSEYLPTEVNVNIQKYSNIKIKLLSQLFAGSRKPIDIIIRSNEKFINLANKLVDIDRYENVYGYVFIITNKVLGYDYNLDKTPDDYNMDPEIEYKLFPKGQLSAMKSNERLDFNMEMYRSGRSYPENWYDREPINKGPIGCWEGYGRGPLTVPATIDNSVKNLIVIRYLHGDDTVYEIRPSTYGRKRTDIAYNIHAYMSYLSMYDDIDPRGNKIPKNIINKLRIMEKAILADIKLQILPVITL